MRFYNFGLQSSLLLSSAGINDCWLFAPPLSIRLFELGPGANALRIDERLAVMASQTGASGLWPSPLPQQQDKSPQVVKVETPKDVSPSNLAIPPL